MSISLPEDLSMPDEEWRPALGWHDYYVSDYGRVLSVKNPRRPVLKAIIPSEQGYAIVFLHDGRQHSVRVHRLVGEAFLGPLPDGLETRHLNGDGMDARLVNLAYGTSVENHADKRRHGTLHNANKTHCPEGHPYFGANLYVIPSSGGRVCRICKKAQMRAFHERRMLAAANVRVAQEAS